MVANDVTVKPGISYRTAAYFFGGLMLFYALLAALFRNRAGWYPAVSDTILLATNLLASLALGYAAWMNRGKNRRLFHAWLLMALGQALYAGGDGVFILLQSFLGEAPSPSIADAFYLGYYPLFAVGLLLLPAIPLGRDERRDTALDIAIIMLSAGLLVWNFLIAPLSAEAEASLLSALITVAYPVFDLILFFFLIRMLFQPASHTAATVLLQAGIALAIGADIAYSLESMAGSYASGSPVDLLYALSYSLTALAGLVFVGRRQPLTIEPVSKPVSAYMRHRLNWTVYLPYFWVSAAFLVVVFQNQVALLPVPILSAIFAVIFALVMIRQILSFRENTRLYVNEIRRRRLAESLSKAAREMTTTLDLDAVPVLILEQLATVVPYERCSIMLEKEATLRIVAQRGFPDNGERTREVAIAIRDDDPYLALARTREPVAIADVTQEPGWTILPWVPLNKSWLGVPLMVRDKVIGMISMTRKEADAFSANDTVLATAFAGQAAVALDNARLYGDLNQAYRTLEILDRTKMSFIKIVAHELRTPLTVIKGYSQTLAVQPSVQSDPDNKVLLDGIVRGMERMQEVVNNMLDVIRIENQVLEMHKETLSLRNLFERIRFHFEKALGERHLSLEFEGLEGLPMIQADPDLMYKVFFQLVINAIKYTPDGGKITVSGRVNSRPHSVEITVADTGIGIDPGQQKVIFEKFYQTGQVALHSSGQTKFKGGGPGLGLPIALGIVSAHGGTLWVESPGHDEQTYPGSRFYVRLPL